MPAADAPTRREDEAGRAGLRPARVVATGLLLSKPTGYARDALLAARFGTGRAMDAYALSSTIATALFDVVGAPLQRVLVPVLVRARTGAGEEGLARTSAAVLLAACSAAAVAGLLLAVGAGPIARVFAGGGALAPEVATLLRWLSLLPLAMTLSAYGAAWLQARERFTLPAFAGLPLDAAIISCVLFAGGRYGVVAAAWGLLLGTLAQFGLEWFGLRRHGHRFEALRPAAARRDPGLVATVRMSPPLWVSVGAVQGALLLPQALAARGAVGGVAALTYAFRVLDVPAALLILPLTTVVLPRLAALAAGGEDADARDLAKRTGWILAAGLVPCALLLALLARPLAAALFEHGAFGPSSALAVGACLLGFAPGIVTSGMQQLWRTYFYSRQNASTPMLWDLVALGVTAVVDLGLARHWGVFGLACGWSAGAAAGWLGLAVAARGPFARGWRRYTRAVAFGTGALVVAGVLVRLQITPWPRAVAWQLGAVRVGLAGSAGAAAYLTAFALGGGVPLLRELVARVRPVGEADLSRRA